MHDLLWKPVFWDWSSVALAATSLMAFWWLMVVEVKRRTPAPEADPLQE
ncbi:MAG: hypothetical protein WCC36_07015 [Gammaproteobacteria bacterium]